jgi:hypothetical protein
LLKNDLLTLNFLNLRYFRILNGINQISVDIFKKIDDEKKSSLWIANLRKFNDQVLNLRPEPVKNANANF